MSRNPWIVLCGAAFALGSSSVDSSDGALEINQDCAAVGCFAGDTAGFPVSISAPGRYRLTSNLNTATTGSVGGITIDTGGNSSALVDVDLNGFELFGGGRCNGNPVTTCTAGSTGTGISIGGFGQTVRLHGGAVRGFGSGITMFAVGSGSSFEDLAVIESTSAGGLAFNHQGAQTGSALFDRVRVVRNNGFAFASSVSGRRLVTHSIFSGNRMAAVDLTAGLTITDSTFTDNGGVGVNCTTTCALGRNSFFNNNGGPTATQFTATTLRDMGGNVCDDGTCP